MSKPGPVRYTHGSVTKGLKAVILMSIVSLTMLVPSEMVIVPSTSGCEEKPPSAHTDSFRGIFIPVFVS